MLLCGWASKETLPELKQRLAVTTRGGDRSAGVLFNLTTILSSCFSTKHFTENKKDTGM